MWMDRLAVSISDEELKKGIEEDGADGSAAEVDDHVIISPSGTRLLGPFLFLL
jgi:hypothetical protein